MTVTFNFKSIKIPHTLLFKMGIFCLYNSLYQICPKGLLKKSIYQSIYTPPIRNLNVHEYVSYTLLNAAGIVTPKFGVATTAAEAKKIAEGLGTNDFVVKAQVLAGGRGKGTFLNGFKSGVRMANSPAQVEEFAGKMLGQKLVTLQTGPKGRICNKVMVVERKYPVHEYYLAVMMERSFGGPSIIASSQGGVNIEQVAAKSPQSITYQPVDIMKGITKDECQKIAERIGIKNGKEEIAATLHNLYKLFIEKDALLLELNPFAEDKNGKFLSLDAKCLFDDNAAYKQKEVFKYRDVTQEDQKEVAARKYGLNFISLDGNIGCLVNGAGLAMATMDLISVHGGAPANFLDVGGGATAEAVQEAFRIITADPKVTAILVNIFGGIMSCAIIAEGIIAAAKTLNMKIPIVCRLLGANVDKARELITASGLKIISVHNLNDAALKVVSLAGKYKK